MRETHRAAVVELGMNHRGETRELGAIAHPTIAIVNNAQREHQEFMTSVKEVAAEHADAILALRPRGTAVINAGDAHADIWRAAARAAGAAVVDFGFHDWADVSARCTLRAGGSDIELRTYAGNARIELHVPGRHMASNALAATAGALAARLPLDAIVRGLTAFRPVTGRLSALRAVSGALVIDDTYNANPDSVRAAIDVLAHAPGAKWLVLGDMGEVGVQGPAFHQEIGAYAKERGVERLFATGLLSRESVTAFGDGAEHIATVDDLALRVQHAATAGVTLLVKGSRSMRMERVVTALTGQASREAH
jgi:UDP-N-acetylmuramoyl-tripeptide--D-alanyl-D-alanine ligase